MDATACWLCNGLEPETCAACGGAGDAPGDRTLEIESPSLPAPLPEDCRWEVLGGGELRPAELNTEVEDAGDGASLLVEIGGVFAPVVRDGFGSSGVPASTSVCGLPFLADKVERPLLESQEGLACLRWMLQKASLQQDMVLLGDFGPTARRLAIAFCRLVGKGMEYLALSRDTAETDLTERVELVTEANGGVSSQMYSAAPVRAARAGHFLVLEGVNFAERNVLSAMNNLLENRELPLSQGLLSHNGNNDMKISPDFLVIAIGNPAQKYPHSGVAILDPPLRSRLAACVAPEVVAPEAMAALRVAITSLEPLRGLLGGDALPSFALSAAGAELMKFPRTSPIAALRTAWPYHLFLPLQQFNAVEDALSNMLSNGSSDPYPLARVGPVDAGARMLTFGAGIAPAVDVRAPCGSTFGDVDDKVMAWAKRLDLSREPVGLGPLLRDHCLGRDVLLVGERGCGKTSLIRRFAELLGYRCQTFFCTAETGARDFTLRRIITAGGSTGYEETPIVDAAVAGDLLVLDGVDRLPAGLLHSVLARLLQDRALELPDGRALAPAAAAAARAGGCDTAGSPLETTGLCIHPSFRVIATASTNMGAKGAREWMEPSLRALFGSTRTLPWAPVPDPLGVLAPLGVSLGQRLLACGARLREAASVQPGDFAPYVLTWRQMQSVVERLRSAGSHADVGAAVLRCFEARLRFAPPVVRKAVESTLEATLGRLLEAEHQVSMPPLQVKVAEGFVMVGDVEALRGGDAEDKDGDNTDEAEEGACRGTVVVAAPLKVDTSCPLGRHGTPFIDVPQHLEVLRGMLAEWAS